MEKVILYGIGSHVELLSDKYNVPMSEIEAIIDNNLAEHFSDDIVPIMKWEEFVLNSNKYSSKYIVVGARMRYEEIKGQILASGLFDSEHIVYIDDWICKFDFSVENLKDYLYRQNINLQEKRLKNAGELPNDLLVGACCFQNREKALEIIPKGGKVAEIGVAFGDFTRVILNTIKPDLFYAVDMFDTKTRGFWNKNIFEQEQVTHEEYYYNRFKEYVDEGKLVMLKGLSWDKILDIPDDSLDYIYIDADHSYESVCKDIDAAYCKIKELYSLMTIQLKIRILELYPQ